MRLGKIVKSNSHCDYVVQVDDTYDTKEAPKPDDFGFGTFVKLIDPNGRLWAVGLIYNSQLFNPAFPTNGPRLSSEPDPIFTPDLIRETLTLLGVVLVGWMEEGDRPCGVHGIPKVVVPINTPVCAMTADEVHRFHCCDDGRPQFAYVSHLLRSGGLFAASLAQQVVKELVESGLFSGTDRRALEILFREMAWKNSLGAIR